VGYNFYFFFPFLSFFLSFSMFFDETQFLREIN
jgi:hypothetical protein